MARHALAALLFAGVAAPAWGQVEGDIRVANGSSASEGRLEIFHDDVWGGVCDDFFGPPEATVACRQLGYADGAPQWRRYSLPAGTNFWLDNVTCSGTEAALARCQHNGWGRHNCAAREAVGVACSATGPVAATGLTASNPTSTTVDLAWTLPAQRSGVTVTAVRVQQETSARTHTNDWRQFAGGRWITAATLSAGAASHTAVGLDASTAYRFRVQMVTNAGNVDSEIVGATTLALGPPGAEGALRLTDGQSPSDGRLEIFHNGVWGGVCDDFFGQPDATVACRQLGYPEGVAHRLRHSLRNGTNFWLDDVSCRGTEASLASCDHKGWGRHNCVAREAVSVACSAASPVKATGLAASNPTSTTVDLAWTLAEQPSGVTATAVQVQRETGGAWTTVATLAADAESHTAVGLDVGTAYRFRVRVVTDAGNAISAAVGATTLTPTPEGALRLADGQSPSDGRLEIFHDGVWGGVCDDLFEQPDATVACRQLGYVRGGVGDTGGRPLPAGLDFWLDDVACSGTEASLALCAHNGWGVHGCSASEAVSVSCSNAGPSKATGLAASNSTSTTVDLAWTLAEQPPGVTVTAVEVQRETGNAWTTVATLAADAESHTAVGLDAGTAYQFRVRVVTDAGNVDSEPVATTTLPPTKATGLAASGATSATVDLAWTLAEQPSGVTVTAVEVQRETGNAWTTVATLAADAESHTVAGLTPASTYRFRVRLVTNAGNVDSEPVGATTLSGGPPATEGDIRLADGPSPSEGRLEIFHDGEWGGICHYPSYGQSGATVACRQLGYAAGGVREGRMRPLPSGRRFWLSYVQCSGTEATLGQCRRSRWGGSCSAFQAMSVACFQAGPVTGLAASNPTSATVDLAWRLPAQPSGVTATAVEVQRRTDGAWATVATLAANTASHTADGLAAATAYWFRVRLVTDAGNADSAPVAAVTSSPDSSAALEGYVRLTDGSSPSDGRLEIFHDGEWGGVCDDFFGQPDATVVCRQLGYADGVRHRRRHSLSAGMSFWLDDVTCSGTEAALALCDHNGWGRHNCSATEAVSVSCSGVPVAQATELAASNPTPATVDLAWTLAEQLSSVTVTAVEVQLQAGAAWTTVATLAADATSHTVSGLDGETAYRFRVRVVTSEGNADSDSVGATTTRATADGDLRLADGPSASHGRLEVFYDGAWGGVCHDAFKRPDATVACRQLGYAAGGVRDRRGRPLPDGMDFWLDNLRCTGTEASLALCGHQGWGVHNCDAIEAVSVACSGSAPSKATGLAASGATRESLDLAWTLPEQPSSVTVTAVEVQQETDDTWTTVATLAAGATSHTAAGLAAATAYSFRVRLVTDAGNADSEPLEAMTALASAPLEGDIRLTDGPSASHGRLEIFHDDVWGGVCDDFFGQPDATVACRQLGYAGGVAERRARPLRDGMQFWLDDVNCSGTEAALARCDANRWGRHNCVAQEAISVNCSGAVPSAPTGLAASLPTSATVYLAWTLPEQPAGVIATAVEVQQETGRTWTTVATLAADATSHTADGLAAATAYSFRIRVVTDAGNADSDSVGATTTSVAAVEGDLRLADGPSASHGRLEVFHDGAWGGVCHDAFKRPDATVACRQLGYARGGARDRGDRPLPEGMDFWLDNLGCTGSEATLALCRHPGWGVHNCSPDEAASVACFDAVPTVPAVPEVSVSDAHVAEGPDAMLDFAVTLDRAAASAVTVGYATADGTARAGEDYEAASGTLRFEVGETEKTVRVRVLDDLVDEGEETLTLGLSDAQGVTIRAGEAEGTIANSDPLQQMWLGRFGRTGASHLVDAVSERLSGLSAGAAKADGQRKDGTLPSSGQALSQVPGSLGTWPAGSGGGFGAWPVGSGGGFGAWPVGSVGGFGAQPIGSVGGFGAQPIGGGVGGFGAWPAGSGADWNGASSAGRELLLGSGFHFAREAGAGGPALTAWGRATTGGFDAEASAEHGTVRMDGEVTTGTVGADVEWNRWLAGVAVSLSEGEGSFSQAEVGSGLVESSLATVSPYARVSLGEGLSAWGLLGYGTGDMTMTQSARADRREVVTRTGISMRLGAAGARGTLLEAGEHGIDLALKADAFLARTESAQAANTVATRADTSRLRLVLEGSRAFALGESAVFTPALELGLRHDGGDADTGTGVELGGRVAYADAASGLSVEARARGLLAHEASGFGEWGASGSVRLGPGPSGRGLSVSLTPTVGAMSGGAERLWSMTDARGLAVGDMFDASARLNAETGYGLGMRGGRFTGTPYAGLGLSERWREWRLGWRLAPILGRSLDFSLGAEVTRTETLDGGERPALGVMLRSELRW